MPLHEENVCRGTSLVRHLFADGGEEEEDDQEEEENPTQKKRRMYRTLEEHCGPLEFCSPATKTMVVPFRRFGPCIDSKVGILTLKYVGDGRIRSVVKKLNTEFRIGEEHLDEKGTELPELLNFLRSCRDVHTTVLRASEGDHDSLTVYECINCSGPRNFVHIKSQKKRCARELLSDLFLLILEDGRNSSRFYTCKISNVFQVCEQCVQVYSVYGHECDAICKPINARVIESIFAKSMCLDVFYDIETYRSSDGSGKFVPGLVAFTLNVRLVNEKNGPREQVANETSSYLSMVSYTLDDMMRNYGVRSVSVSTLSDGSDAKPCYYVWDESLEEKNDVMLSFLDLVEVMTKYLMSFTALNVNQRVSVISFNGNKFDDFFLFKALTKKGGFCAMGLEECTVLERGSRLLCIPFRFKLTSGRTLYFRTQDLRNFLCTGGLADNAVKFDVSARKTVFPHTLIEALRDGKVPPVLTEFPPFEYYEGVLKTPRSCTHPLSDCSACKRFEYEELRRDWGENHPFDVQKVWIDYCCNDVLVTERLYYRFMDVLRNQFAPLFPPNKSFDPSSKLTLPSLTNSLAYSQAMVQWKKLLRTPTSDFLKSVYSAVYGGHCQTTIIGSVPEPEKFVFFDFNGEYSGLMTAPFPCGRVKRIGEKRRKELETLVRERWARSERVAHFQDAPGFVVFAELRAPTDTRMHFDLPNVPVREGKRGSLMWNNRSKRGYYSSVDLFVARHYYDYEVRIVPKHTNLEFEEWQPLLKSYVEYCQRLKAEGKAEGNKAKENVGKLMGNSLYGYQIKKPDCEKMEFVKDRETYATLALQEQVSLIKIKSVCPVKDILNSKTLPYFIIEKSHVAPYDDGLNLPLYSDNFVTPEERLAEPDACDYPVYVKYEVSDAFRLECNTLPQIGVFVLSYSRLLNAQLYFDCFIKPNELELALDDRPPVVVYTDTDSFLTHGSRLEGTPWNGFPNVRYDYENKKFEPWGKNELDFVPEKIVIAGKKLYACKGPSDDPKKLKTACKGVDKHQVTMEKFERLVARERVLFEQESFKKNFDTYDIECNVIKRELGLGEISMKPIRVCPDYVLYRPFNDEDDEIETKRLSAVELEEETEDEPLLTHKDVTIYHV